MWRRQLQLQQLRCRPTYWICRRPPPAAARAPARPRLTARATNERAAAPPRQPVDAGLGGARFSTGRPRVLIARRKTNVEATATLCLLLRSREYSRSPSGTSPSLRLDLAPGPKRGRAGARDAQRSGGAGGRASRRRRPRCILLNRPLSTLPTISLQRNVWKSNGSAESLRSENGRGERTKALGCSPGPLPGVPLGHLPRASVSPPHLSPSGLQVQDVLLRSVGQKTQTDKAWGRRVEKGAECIHLDRKANPVCPSLISSQGYSVSRKLWKHSGSLINHSSCFIKYAVMLALPAKYDKMKSPMALPRKAENQQSTIN
ncbi:uncharacterized protein [Kogia breviceps]|uniref:uncharacterized protein n=1 Tax=Kogia breviceps TaxID=27615 RepID=UPI0034D1655C